MATAQAATSNAIYWLALSLTPGLGPTRGRKLVERFGNIQDIFHASLTELVLGEFIHPLPVPLPPNLRVLTMGPDRQPNLIR